MLAATRMPGAQRPFVATSRRSTVQVQAKFNYAPVLDEIAKDQLKKDPPRYRIGDTVKVGVAVVEGKGKTRTQKLEGTIIAEHGAGINKTFTFRRMFQGVGIELIMPLHSPAVQSMELVRHGKVRRAKLYYLRGLVGKAAKLKEILRTRKPAAAKAPPAEAAAAPAPAEATPTQA